MRTSATENKSANQLICLNFAHTQKCKHLEFSQYIMVTWLVWLHNGYTHINISYKYTMLQSSFFSPIEKMYMYINVGLQGYKLTLGYILT